MLELIKKQVLDLYCALSRHRLFKQATTCGYFWKDNKKMHAALEILNNQNEKIKLAKVKLKYVNRGRISDDQNNFVTSNTVSIVADIPTHSIGNHMKHIDISRTNKYSLFRRENLKRKLRSIGGLYYYFSLF